MRRGSERFLRSRTSRKYGLRLAAENRSFICDPFRELDVTFLLLIRRAGLRVHSISVERCFLVAIVVGETQLSC